MSLCVGLGSAKLWAKNGIHVKNSLGPGNTLMVFCKWNDEQLGTVFLSTGQTYDFSFRGKFVFKNKIDCNLSQGTHIATIRAFESGSGAFDHGKQNFWDAREDGIYFTHGSEAPKLEYKWQSS